MENTHQKMNVYLEKLSQIIDIKSDNSFDFFAYNDLKPFFNQPAFYSSDYPFLVDLSGNLIIHLYKESQRYPRELLNKMISEPQKKGYFDVMEYRNNKELKMRVYFHRVENLNAFIGIPVDLSEVTHDLRRNSLLAVLFVFMGTLIILVFTNIALSPALKTIELINNVIKKMGNGEIGQPISYDSTNEIGQIVNSLNSLISVIERNATFADEICHNKLDSDFKPLGPNDRLGNALINLQESLKTTSIEQAKRKEEDDRRIWINTGLAMFGDILRQNNNNLQLLSDSITQNLINYLDANQGGLFILNDENQEVPHLDLLSAFAFNRKKSKKKTIHLGEGLVGNCAIEKHTIYLKEIPEDYIEITSGLGDSPPRTLLIVPLKVEDKVFGVIEISSFHEFLPHEVEFVEKIGESIASTLSAVKNNIRTNELLEQSQQQKEEMLAQEEEMRQNMEEMQATQEEMARKTLEMEGMTSAINESLLFGELTENGSFIIGNSNLLNTLGYSKIELEGKTILDFIHLNDSITFKTIWNDTKMGTPFKGTLKWINRQQEEIFILCSITPSFDEYGNLYKIFLLGQDVTQSKLLEIKAQKQAEEIEASLQEIQLEQELSQQREEEMKALLQALDSTCLVTEVDPDGRIKFINNKNVETLGDSKQEIEEKFHYEIDFQAKAYPDLYKAFWSDLLNGIPRQRDFSLNVNEKTVWISEYYTPIMDSSGNVAKIIIIGIDVTRSKETELMLIKQIDDLKQILKNSNISTKEQ
jgi:PAS domain S-box-containing protein